MSTVRLHTAQTDELTPERLGELTDLCEAAFGVPFGEGSESG